MREIKFRGYNKQKGWLYGVLERNLLTNEYSIRNFDDAVSYSVEEDSISQYTCYIDKNGKEIYEGDIVKIDKNAKEHFYIQWGCGRWQAVSSCAEYAGSLIDRFAIIDDNTILAEVIGNTYEEKLKEGK